MQYRFKVTWTVLLIISALSIQTGRAVTIGASGITTSGGTDYDQSDNVVLSAHQTWNAASGEINVTGNINGNYKRLTITGADDTTLSGVLSNLAYSNGLVKAGTGTLNLAGNNTFNGPITIQSGTVQLSHDNALGGNAWGNTVQAGGALALSNNINVTQGSFNIGGSGSGGSGSLVNVSGNNTLNSNLTLTADSIFTSNQDLLTLTQTVALGNHDLTLQGEGDWDVSGNLDANSNGTLHLEGDGATHISGNVNVSGGVVIDNSGTVDISGNLNLSNSSLTIQGDTTATLTGSQVNASGGLIIADNANADIANSLNLGGSNIQLSSAGTIALSGNQINVGNISLTGDGSTTFASQINASSFTQTGSGTTTFSGTGNNYFGSVSIEGGTVIAAQNGVAFHTNDLNVENAVLEFGADSQIPAWTEVTLDNATVYLGGTNQTWDQLTITGNSIIDFGDSGELYVGSLIIAEGAQLTIDNWSEENMDIFNAQIDPDGSTPNVIFTGSGGTTWDPITGDIVPGAIVPEPGTYGFWLMLASLLAWQGSRPRSLRHDH